MQMNVSLKEIAQQIYDESSKYNRHAHSRYEEFKEIVLKEESLKDLTIPKAIEFVLFAKPCIACGKLAILSKFETCGRICSAKVRYDREGRLKAEDEKRKSEGAIQCKICGEHTHSLSWHLTKHKISIEDYEAQFGVGPRHSEQWLNNNKKLCFKSDETNPGWNHGGKMSPFSKNSIYHSEETRIAANEKRKRTTKENPQNQTTRIEFWLAQGLSEDEAREALSERQTTFSLEKCIEKFGEAEGRKVWTERQTKWQNTLKAKDPEEIARINRLKLSSGYSVSKAENEIFEVLKHEFPEIIHQKSLITNEKRAFVFDLAFKQKLIEYNGDFWHLNPNLYKEDDFHPIRKLSAEEIWNIDRRKVEFAKDSGFEILVIWESDYKSNKEKVIEQCRNFLTK